MGTGDPTERNPQSPGRISVSSHHVVHEPATPGDSEHPEIGGHEAAPEADRRCHERPPCGDVPSCPLSQQKGAQSHHPACPQSPSSLTGTSWTVVTCVWGPSSPQKPPPVPSSPPGRQRGEDLLRQRRILDQAWRGEGEELNFGLSGCKLRLLLCSSCLVGILQRCRALGGPGAAAES